MSGKIGWVISNLIESCGIVSGFANRYEYIYPISVIETKNEQSNTKLDACQYSVFFFFFLTSGNTSNQITPISNDFFFFFCKFCTKMKTFLKSLMLIWHTVKISHFKFCLIAVIPLNILSCRLIAVNERPTFLLNFKLVNCSAKFQSCAISKIDK